MKKRITLWMDEEVIAKGKLFAKKNGKSVSQLVSDYFYFLDNPTTQKEEIPPITRSLLGALREKNVDEGDYEEYLEKKYLD